jgi:hypothetical protein
MFNGGLDAIESEISCDRPIPWASSVLEQMLSWYSNSALHCALLEAFPVLTSKCQSNVTLPMLNQGFILLHHSNINRVRSSGYDIYHGL